MNAILQQIGLMGIVPVVVIDDAKNAAPLAGALTDAGLPCAEVTFRTDAAAKAIMEMARAYPKMLVGAGTILNVEQVKIAIDSGARFIVCPGVNRGVVEYCMNQGIPVTPGIATPTEVGMALDLGVTVMKFFPAEASGGLPYLNAISAPFRSVKFIPTGGIDETNILQYLKLENVLACGGSWMVKEDLISEGKFGEISELTRQAIRQMFMFELRMIGMSSPDEQNATIAADALRKMLGLTTNGNDHSSTGRLIDVAKQSCRGVDGEILVATPFIDRAIAYAKRKGAEELSETPDDIRVSVNFGFGRYAVRFVEV